MTYQTIDDANQAVINKVVQSAPFLLDVVPANQVIPVFSR